MATPSIAISADAPMSPRRARSRERRIAQALRQRTPEAMAMVMQAHGPALLRYLEGMLQDRSLAEDVLQHVLIEIWQRGASYDPARAGLLTWMMLIARSRAIDALRRPVPDPMDPTVVAEFDGLTEPDATDRLLEQWRMAALLKRLPQDEASLLRMRFYEGLTQSDIAEQTGIALGTVKTRMVNGLEHLRRLLDAEEAGDVR